MRRRREGEQWERRWTEQVETGGKGEGEKRVRGKAEKPILDGGRGMARPGHAFGSPEHLEFKGGCMFPAAPQD